MGFNAEVHEEQVKLNGYSGRGAQPKAHIVVRKNQFNGYGDAGFERVKEGGFRLHVDDYDHGRRSDKLKMAKIKQVYSANIIEKTVRKTSKFTLLSRRKNKNGEIKIRVRRMGN